MKNPQTGRPAGKTGPIAAAVKASNDTYRESSLYACGEAWAVRAKYDGAMSDASWRKNIRAEINDMRAMSGTPILVDRFAK
jgi:hypothetical protein